VALYVGRLSREKSLDRLLAGFQLVRREVPDATLLLVGDGPLRRELEGAGCPGLVVAGAITGDALATVYASADVFVFPSETETFGNVVIEAQASGLPVVVADRGAAQEHVVEGVTGFLRDPRDHAGTAAAVVRLLRDGEARRRMGAAAAQHARRYDQADALRGTLRLYDRILEELRGPRPGLGRPPAGRQMHDLVA
jgi:glycosyltransferase involved in cell wall biosynthesis